MLLLIDVTILLIVRTFIAQFQGCQINLFIYLFFFYLFFFLHFFFKLINIFLKFLPKYISLYVISYVYYYSFVLFVMVFLTQGQWNVISFCPRSHFSGVIPPLHKIHSTSPFWAVEGLQDPIYIVIAFWQLRIIHWCVP